MYVQGEQLQHKLNDTEPSLTGGAAQQLQEQQQQLAQQLRQYANTLASPLKAQAEAYSQDMEQKGRELENKTMQAIQKL